MFNILMLLANFITKIGKWLVILSIAVVAIGLLTWAIPQVLGFSEYIPIPWQASATCFIVVAICKKVLKR